MTDERETKIREMVRSRAFYEACATLERTVYEQIKAVRNMGELANPVGINSDVIEAMLSTLDKTAEALRIYAGEVTPTLTCDELNSVAYGYLLDDDRDEILARADRR